MNLNFSVEEFLEGIEKAKNSIPKKPTVVVKNATVTGVKLNSKTISSIPKSEEPIPFYEGIKVYHDDSLDKPHFIVEGEIEKKNYLKWEDLEFKIFDQEISVLLNGNKYSLKYYTYDIGDMAYLYKENRNIFVFDGRCSEDKQFFNDLHLEVEE